MEPTHLDVDELNYELEIRGFAKTHNVRLGTKTLRDALLKESKGESEIPRMTDPAQFELEFKTASLKLDEIDSNLSSVLHRLSSEEVKQFETKLRHIKGRLERLLNNKDNVEDVKFLLDQARGCMDHLFLQKHVPGAKTNPLDASKSINTVSPHLSILNEASTTNEESEIIDVLGELSDFNIMGGNENSVEYTENDRELRDLLGPISDPISSTRGISPIPRNSLLRTVQNRNFVASIPNQMGTGNRYTGTIPKVSLNKSFTSSTLNNSSYVSAINRPETTNVNNTVKNVQFKNTPEIIDSNPIISRNLFNTNRLQPVLINETPIRPRYHTQKLTTNPTDPNFLRAQNQSSSVVPPINPTQNKSGSSYYDGIFSKQPVTNSNFNIRESYNQFFPAAQQRNIYPVPHRQGQNTYQNYNQFFPEANHQNIFPRMYAQVPIQVEQYPEPQLYEQQAPGQLNRPRGASCRYRSPVASWNLVFSGNSAGRSLNDFLSQVQMYARADGVSDIELLRAAVYLFSGPALTWYRAYGTRFVSWEHLVQTLRQEFLPYDYDYGLLREIEQRKQGKGESFAMFLANMEMMYRGLQHTRIPEQQMIDTLMRNLLPYYAEKLVMCNVASVRDLSLHCKRIENFQFRMNKSSCSDNSSTLLEPQFAFRTKPIQRNLINAIETNPEPYFPATQFASVRASCFNCQAHDHDHKNCPSPKLRIFCYNCGELGQLATFCFNCNPNSENRMRDITPKGRGQYPQQRRQ